MRRPAAAVAALALFAAFGAGPAKAQTLATASASPAPDPAANPPAASAPASSETMALNLVRLLVQQGVITQAAADALVQKAQADARQAPASSGEAPPPGVIRVPYVPEVVRNEIREELKRDVMAQAKAEGWASPHALPDWLDHVTWFGDFRLQDQFNLYSKGNDNPIIDYATFNANGPTDINANTNPHGLPFLNTLTNRLNQVSVRARFGVRFDVNDNVSMTFRLASGSNNGPVSTTQLLGGGLTKKDVWLDQAYLTLKREGLGQISLGRMPNYFMHTDLVFSDNLNFDGVQGRIERPINDQLSLFGVGAVLPLSYVASGFPTDQADKAKDRTKWMFGVQIGAHFEPTEPSWSLTTAVAFYDFDNVQGQVSAPCDISQDKQCSTDSTRPDFMQKGNTLFLLRDIVANNACLSSPSPTASACALPQFVGLSYNYRLIDLTTKFEFPLFGDVRAQLQADYVRNLAYNPAKILANPLTPPVNNHDDAPPPAIGPYHSGPNAWMAEATIGYPDSGRRGDWTLSMGYKYIEPDAVLDAFNDNDFHLGGTNAKGYFITGTYNIFTNTWLDFRWYSTTNVFGSPLAIDSLFLELNTRF
jgi:hypothetical protein